MHFVTVYSGWFLQKKTPGNEYFLVICVFLNYILTIAWASWWVSKILVPLKWRGSKKNSCLDFWSCRFWILENTSFVIGGKKTHIKQSVVENFLISCVNDFPFCHVIIHVDFIIAVNLLCIFFLLQVKHTAPAVKKSVPVKYYVFKINISI